MARMTANRFTMTACGEWVAHDPQGRPRSIDGRPELLGSPVRLCAARGGYASFRLLVRGRGRYRLSARASGGLAVDLYRAWYHRFRRPGRPDEHWPDALVPVKRGADLALPDRDNRVPGQKVQEFWVDVFVPAGARPGEASGRIVLASGAGSVALPLCVTVLPARLPDEPAVAMDNNSYGCRWLPGMYPRCFAAARRGGQAAFWRTGIELLHHYHRISREHRTVFHNLGYGHSGQMDPIYAPRLSGSGRALRLGGWGLFDAHYGPLLDGRAFRRASPRLPGPRTRPLPIWGVYTPINPDWPADYLWWNEPGYRAEFVGGLRQFDAHLARKGWTSGRIEFFFNHKKRYRWYEWDGDEQKYAKDNARHQAMINLWEEATGKSRVRWVYRADASWQMKRQFDELGGHRNFWVCGGFVSWYPRELRAVLARGEEAWWYGGYPPIQAASSAVLQNLWRTWARGLGGFCHWLAVQPGPDPWFDCNGAATGPIYPGERFGIPGPLPSIRLKILRNGIQDIDLLDTIARRKRRLEAVRRGLIRKVSIVLWEKPPANARKLPPEDWDSENLATEHEPVMEALRALRTDWWKVVRRSALTLAAEEVR
jgi:hypothetical protein